MSDKPLKQEEIKKELDIIEAVKGNQRIRVDAYLEPTSYTSFYMREDSYKYYGVKPTVAETVNKAQPKRPAKTTTPKDTNKGNGVSYSQKGGRLPDKKIKLPTTGGDVPAVNSKSTKKKKWITIRVPTYMPSAAIALWINTAFDENRKPTFFILESGTRISIDPGFKDPTGLKPIKSFVTKTNA